MLNPFFKNFGPFNIEKLLSKVSIENKKILKKIKFIMFQIYLMQQIKI